MKALLPLLRTKLFLLGSLFTCTFILANNYVQRNHFFKFTEVKEEIVAKPEKLDIPIKKVARKKINLQLQENSFRDASANFEATVTSDYPEYAPLSTATFTGAGFLPNENVVLKVKNLSQPCNTVTADSSYFPWTVTADANGEFITTWTVCNCSGDSLRLKATGQTSGFIAYAYFLDGPGTMAVSPASVCAGSTGNSFTFTFSRPNGTPNNYNAGSQATVIVPTGWTTPQSTLAGSPGYVSVAATGGAAAPSIASISAGPPWTITINFTSTSNGQGFSLSYGGGGTAVTASSTAGSHTFTTQTKQGSGGSFSNVTSQPVITVNSLPTLAGASQAATVCAGSGAVINLTGLVANSTSTINYTINGVAQAPVTNVVANGSGAASFTSANLTAANNGQTLQITNVTITSAVPNCTASFTQNVTLSVNPNPTLTGASQDATVCAGSGATINLIGLLANSTSTINYTINGSAQTPVTGVVANGSGDASFTSANLTAANNGQTLRITGVTVTSATPNCTASFTQDVTLSVNPNPTLTGALQAAAVCAGSGATINLTGLRANSTSTINYTINGVAQTPVTGIVGNGSGAASFTSENLTAANNGQTLQVTSVTITSATPNCTASFTQNVTLTVRPNPTLTGASQAATVCAGSGATINLTGLITNSTSTINYTINGVAQTPVTNVVANGSGAASFTSANLTAANNGQTLQITSVTITSATPNCTTSFTQNVTLSVNPNPTLTGATQAATVCAGSGATINLIGLLANSTSTINYTINGSAQTPVTGVVANGSGDASFTSANLTAANNGQTLRITGVTVTSATPNCTASFTQDVTLSVNPNPTLTGASQAAAVCAGSGATINLTGLRANSTSTINYTINGVAQTPVTGVVANGAGAASFATPNLTAANNGQTLQITSITTTSAAPNCTASFTQNVTLTVRPNPTLTGASQASAVCDGSAATINLTGLLANSTSTINYTINGAAQTPETGVVANGSGAASFTTPNLTTANNGQTLQITSVTTTSATPNCTTTFAQNVTLSVNPLPTIFNVSFTGSLCGTATITLSGTQTGVNYALLRGSATEETKPGTGSSISFSPVTQTGTYTVVATNTSTGCSSTMTGSVVMGGGTPPTSTFFVTGGGIYCAGGPGMPVGLNDTETGVTYQLYLDGNPVGSTLAGTGSAISFGNQTGTGTYTVVGTKTSGDCTATMTGNVQISIDTTPPTLTSGGAALTLGCNPSAGDINAALGTATATDAVTTPTVTSSDGSVASNGCLRSQTRTFTAKDACNNTSTVSRTATWTADVTKPVFTGNYNAIDLDCNPTAAAIEAALGSASATDGCSDPSISASDNTETVNGCVHSQTRTFTATDHCGNAQTISRTVSWIVDVTKPVFTGSYAAIDLDCNPTAAAIEAALGSASATDGCSNPSITASDNTETVNGCNHSQTRTFTATDHCGNAQTISRTVSWIVDVTKPVFTGSYAAIDLDCNPTAAAIEAALGSASATDGCSNPSISASDNTETVNGCVHSQTRTFTATDHCGNAQTISRTVSWIVDVTKPVFTGNYNAIDLDCNPTAAAIEAALGSASATDGCSNPSISASDNTETVNGCVHSQTRTFTATDHCGNAQTISRTVSWIVDVTKPVFTGSYAAIDLDCNPTAAAIEAALGSASATDGCSNPSISASR